MGLQLQRVHLRLLVLRHCLLVLRHWLRHLWSLAQSLKLFRCVLSLALPLPLKMIRWREACRLRYGLL